ncbi:MAG: dihydrolipoyl dehydrogenase [Solobacterium sp.]|nr:dihydrolipoyl dehydrogenase [Solobacterium sp.]
MDTNINKRKVDIVIIGGGTGGYVAAIYASRMKKKVIIIEENKLGGTCLNEGCIPTKSLITSAHKYQDALAGDTFGFHVEGEIKVDLEKMIERKNKVVDRLVSGVSFLMKKNEIEVIQGKATFIDDHCVCVNEGIIEFEDCLIATGSTVAIPKIKGCDSERIYTSTTLLNHTVLPNSLCVIGGGVIGLEFAFLMKNLGVDVQIVEYLDTLLPQMDQELVKELLRQAKKKRIKIHLSSKVSHFEEKDDGIITYFEKEGKEEKIESEIVLLATGRKANIDGLGLENTSIKLREDGKGIKVDEYMRTSVEHIYAVGDVNGILQLAHAASAQGMVAINHIVGKEDSYLNKPVPSVIFTDPEIATVGLSEEEAIQKGIAYKKGMFHYRANGKALVMDEIDGWIKILKDEKDVIIGAHIIGADASSLIASLALCISNKLKDEDIEKTIFAHPTTAEVIHEAALDLSIGAFHE